ncbi:MAG: hypothetical protein IPJ65_07315 [Archangiaceae bacterium]|nr:hypothetical protein [Archangiaceae bacterium]
MSTFATNLVRGVVGLFGMRLTTVGVVELSPHFRRAKLRGEVKRARPGDKLQVLSSAGARRSR